MEELKDIIIQFNLAQAKAIEILENDFNCHKPKSQDDFISRCVQIIREQNYQANGYKIRPHGIGMEININGTKIDFDFGANGEFNGFDSWRLFQFIQNNKIQTQINSESQLNGLFKSALAKGFIIKGKGKGNVHYTNS